MQGFMREYPEQVDNLKINCPAKTSQILKYANKVAYNSQTKKQTSNVNDLKAELNKWTYSNNVELKALMILPYLFDRSNLKDRRE